MTVYLVGAGPGDPGLITRRGAELLARADVVVHDRLVDPAVLALAAPRARLIDVGKAAGGGAAAACEDQRRINELLVVEAQRHGTVVRLKGGDPFLFGRGADEAMALAGAGVDYEVVPGVASAFAVPAAAGTPVTQRGMAGSVSVLSGHDLAEVTAPGTGADSGGRGAALDQLAGADTLVVLMAGATFRRLAERLIAAGRDATTPALVVERGTTPEQRSWRGTLGQLAAGQAPDAFGSPALIVVGATAAMALRSYEQRPLAGWRVVVTRAEHQAASLSAELAALGARPVELPLIELIPPSDGGAALASAAGHLATYDWVVFTSANAVERFVALLHDARAFGAAKVAAIGSATADALAGRGIVADLVPARFVAEDLLAAFPRPGSGRVLLPRAGAARAVLPDGLRGLGWQVDVVEAYRTAHAELSPEQLELLATADAVTVTSSSTVQALAELVPPGALPPVVASIGPITTATAAACGIEVSVEATTSTVAGLATALAEHARATGRGQSRPVSLRP